MRALALHNAATWFMVGLIWLVQVVHYPMFARLDRASFSASHAFHSRRITYVVGPAMVLEFALAAWLLWARGMADSPALVAFVLLLVAWACTFFVIVPLHAALGRDGFRPPVHEALVRWNWVRTVAWSARGVIAYIFW